MKNILGGAWWKHGSFSCRGKEDEAWRSNTITIRSYFRITTQHAISKAPITMIICSNIENGLCQVTLAITTNNSWGKNQDIDTPGSQMPRFCATFQVSSKALKWRSCVHTVTTFDWLKKPAGCRHKCQHLSIQKMNITTFTKILGDV